MKRSIGWLASLLFILFTSFNTVNAEALDIETERIIVGFEEEVDLSVLENVQADVHHQFANIPAIAVTVPKTEREALKQLPHVKWVEHDGVVKTEAQQTNWGYNLVKPPKALQSGYTGKGVKIAIIDTGVNDQHPDLHIAGGVSFIGDRTSYTDVFGHGTHVAGIIGALNNDIGIVGIAPEASIYAVRALDDNGFGNQTNVIAGIDWAIEHEMDIINLSLTTKQDSYALKKVLAKAYEKGILIVAASGNTKVPLPEGTDVLYPARYPSVIAVGSIDEDHLYSSFSYTGKSLEITAPGSYILTTSHVLTDNANGDYIVTHGTSIATPFVAGVLALYKEAFPELDHKEIRHMMQINALDLGTPGKNKEYGYGLIQAPTKDTTPYSDVREASWYTPSVQHLSGEAIISGYPDGTFQPHEVVTRAEAVTMIGKILNVETDSSETIFTDVKPASFAAPYIQAASELAMITGFPDGSFKPDDPIVRGDVAILMKKAFHLPDNNTASFRDVRPEAYYYEAVNSLKTAHMTNGYPDHTFKPNESITRSELTVLLSKAMNETRE
ncbi:S8 family peptidase [Bacillus chungangensis]|uniref:SLH domain-containing protein n=1 Tax=Bacillus chungangensis TaxID=587633 RepID=A0ABT9WVM6_9BACI|nr:S8 family serine peptidase [Bacillus chungangensis]MDQ0177153.1 hypothetical protein [Bacillus chungangensis]